MAGRARVLIWAPIACAPFPTCALCPPPAPLHSAHVCRMGCCASASRPLCGEVPLGLSCHSPITPSMPEVAASVSVMNISRAASRGGTPHSLISSTCGLWGSQFSPEHTPMNKGLRGHPLPPCPLLGNGPRSTAGQPDTPPVLPASSLSLSPTCHPAPCCSLFKYPCCHPVTCRGKKEL